MSSIYRGNCLCGQTAFEVNAEPIITSCCHCSNCKKYTGTAFTTNLVFPANTQKIVKGEHLVKIFADKEQDSGNVLYRHFCSECGAPLFNTNGDFGKTIAVFYGALEMSCTAGKQPAIEYYSKDRLSWLPPFPGTEKTMTKPGRE